MLWSRQPRRLPRNISEGINWAEALAAHCCSTWVRTLATHCYSTWVRALAAHCCSIWARALVAHYCSTANTSSTSPAIYKYARYAYLRSIVLNTSLLLNYLILGSTSYCDFSRVCLSLIHHIETKSLGLGLWKTLSP